MWFNAFDTLDDAASKTDARHGRLVLGPDTAVEGFVQIVKTEK